MKIVIAPDKFKGSLSGRDFCDIVAKQFELDLPEATITKLPLADGGDGTLAVLQDHLNAETIVHTVNDPLFRPIQANYLYSSHKKLAFIEMAEASGHWRLKPEELNCLRTSTLGTGELIADAIARGAKEICLGIGGSATNDGGMGVAEAIGYSFLDSEGASLEPIGANLHKVHSIVAPKSNQLDGIVVKVASDVKNPFFGKTGAAHIYAKQKGASPEEIVFLDKGLQHFASLIKTVFHIDLQRIPGSGAAGGLGGGAVAFLNAELVSGIDLIKEMLDFDTAIQGSDWIITGEGKLDNQTLSGKTIGGVLDSARKQSAKVAAFCGKVTLTKEEEKNLGIDYVVSISEHMPNLKMAMQKAKENLAIATGVFIERIKN